MTPELVLSWAGALSASILLACVCLGALLLIGSICEAMWSSRVEERRHVADVERVRSQLYTKD